MDAEKTMAWVENAVNQALTEARTGNTLLLNRLGKNPALAHYINNVATLRSVPREAWGTYYPQFLAEADRLRTEYELLENAVNQADRLSKLEESFAELKGEIQAALAQLTESKTPDKPAKKGKAVLKEEEEQTAPVEEPEAATPPAPTEPEGDTDDESPDEISEQPEA